jgi:hypothetical protein
LKLAERLYRRLGDEGVEAPEREVVEERAAAPGQDPERSDPLRVTAVIPRADLARLVASITPFRVILDEERGRAVTLEHPTIELVPGRGIRLRGRGVVSWDLALVSVPVQVNAWKLLLVPRVASRGGSHIVSLEPVLEELDLKSVPGLVDEKLAAGVRRAITEHRDRLAWDLGRTLSKSLPLPATVAPKGVLAIVPLGGEVAVDEREVRLTLRFDARFEAQSAGERRAVARTGGKAESAPEEVSRAAHPRLPPLGRVLSRKRPRPPARSRMLRRPRLLRG